MKGISLVRNTIVLLLLIAGAVIMIPRSLEAAPEITDPYVFNDNYGPNPLGRPVGLVVCYGGYVQDSVYPIAHVEATYLPPPASSLAWSEYLISDGIEYWNLRSSENFSGLEPGQSWGSVQITATNTQGQTTTVDTPELSHPLVIPLASNIRFSDTGLTPTITWDPVTFDHDLNPGTPEVPVDHYRLRIYRGDTLDEIYHTEWWEAFSDPTFEVPSGVLSPGSTYWVRIISNEQVALVNRSSTYVSFTTANACPCDLNADGRCDMRDWLLFGREWGRTDCPVQR